MTHPFGLRQVRSRFGYDCYTAKLRHRLSLFDTLQGPRARGLQKRIRIHYVEIGTAIQSRVGIEPVDELSLRGVSDEAICWSGRGILPVDSG